MSGREQLYADVNEVARIDGSPLMSEAAMAEVVGLIEAHQAYDVAENMNKPEIAALDAQIAALTKQRKTLDDQRERENRIQGNNRHTHNDRLTSILGRDDDKSRGTHPIYAAALLAPSLDQGSLWYPNTLHAVDHLGKSLVQLDRVLIAANDSMPVASFSYHRNSADELEVNYGFTKSRAGLSAHVTRAHVGRCGCGAKHFESRPHIQIPVVEPSLAAVELAPRRYTTSTGQQTALGSDGKPKKDVVSWGIPEAKAPNIPLPTGDVHFKGDHLLALYDNGQEVVELRGPRKFGSSQTTLVAIGERAVKTALVELNDQIDAQRQGNLLKDMSLFVASALGVALKKSDLKRSAKLVEAGV